MRSTCLDGPDGTMQGGCSLVVDVAWPSDLYQIPHNPITSESLWQEMFVAKFVIHYSMLHLNRIYQTSPESLFLFESSAIRPYHTQTSHIFPNPPPPTLPYSNTSFTLSPLSGTQILAAMAYVSSSLLSRCSLAVSAPTSSDLPNGVSGQSALPSKKKGIE